MISGSLTIGGTNTSYGGSSYANGTLWTNEANTAGLLLECSANTEIAVHDGGTRVASLMYYEGNATNKITIGRNMGWGAISVVNINGTLQVAGTDISTTYATKATDIINTSNYASNVSNVLLAAINTNSGTSNYASNISNVLLAAINTNSGTSNYASNVSNVLNDFIYTNTSNLYLSDIILHQIYDLTEKPYPSKEFNNSTSEIQSTNEIYNINPTTYIKETITLNSTGITHGIGTYIIYSSSTINNVDSRKALLFNKNINRSTGDNGSVWAYNSYLLSDGSYTGESYIKNGYLGEWIIIKLTNSIILSRFIFNIASTFVFNAPSLWRCYGSNDGFTWEEIEEASNNGIALTSANYTLNNYENICNNNKKPYLYIGFTFKKVVGTPGGTGGNTLYFTELQLFGKELAKPFYNPSNVISLTLLNTSNYATNISNILNNNSSNYASNISNVLLAAINTNSGTSNYASNISNILNDFINTNISNLYSSDIIIYSPSRQYPPKLYDTDTNEITNTNELQNILPTTYYKGTITINPYLNGYGIGTYTIYTSSYLISTTQRKQLFDTNTEDGNSHWGNNKYTATTGSYSLGGTSCIVSGYTGDWIIIKFPYSIILTKFAIYKRTDIVSRAPSLWKCYGSTNGINFIEITEASNSDVLNALTSGNYSPFYEKKLSTFSTPYLYIGFTFNKLVGGDGVSTVLNFSELQLFGKEQVQPFYISSNIFNTSITNSSNYVSNISNVIITNSSNYASNISNILNINSSNYAFNISNILLDAINTNSGTSNYASNISNILNINSSNYASNISNVILTNISNNYLNLSGGTLPVGNIILSSGNIGIGTTNVTSKLYISAATNGDGGANNGLNSCVYIKQNTVWTAAQPWALFVEGYSSLGGFRINAADSQRGLLANSQLGFATTGSSIITFTQNTSTEVMRIGNFNVGIGTTDTSTYKLNINGSLNSSSLYLNNSLIDFTTYATKSIDIRNTSNYASNVSNVLLTNINTNYLAKSGGTLTGLLTTTNIDCTGGIAVSGANAFYTITNVEANNLTNTYFNLKDAGANSDWCYIRQIGVSDNYKLAFDFHDDLNAVFCIRGINSHAAGTGPDTVNEVFTVNNGNTNMTGTCTATSFIGSGASLTSLDATKITTGTLPIARGGTQWNYNGTSNINYTSGNINTGSIILGHGVGNLLPNSNISSCILLSHNTYNDNLGYCFPNPECAIIMANNGGNSLPWGFYNGVVKYLKSNNPYNSLRYDIGNCSLNTKENPLAGMSDTYNPILSIMYSGNVGIGNTFPFASLNIGTPLIPSGVSDGTLVISKNNGTLGRNFKLGYDSSFNFIMGDFGYSNLLNTQINQFIIQNGAYANSLILKSSGDVDIVSDVSSSSTKRYLNVGGLRLAGWDSNTIYNSGILGLSSLSNLTLNTGTTTANLTTRLIIDNTTGNIGIGTTTNSSFTLNVLGSLNATTINENGNNISSIYDTITDRQLSISDLTNIYVSSNQLYNYTYAYSSPQPYPPKLYNNITTETPIIFLTQSAYYQVMTLNTLGITYGSGTYEIYSSSIYNTANTYNKGLLFNYNQSEAITAAWQNNTYDSTGVYINTNNKYINSGYLGDWIVVKLPTSIILTSFKFYPYTATDVLRSPGEWKCYGSTDNTNFTEIAEGSQTSRLVASNYTTNGFYEKTLPGSFSTPYQYFGWCINKLVGISGQTFLHFSELKIYGKEVIPTITNVKYLSSNLLPNIQKKNGFKITCSKPITLNGNAYFKYDIDLTKYTQNLLLSDNSPYRSFNINCFIASGYFNLLSNNLPRVFNYNVYMSNEASTGGNGEIAGIEGINICATGTPENYNLDKIPPNYLFLLRTNDYNFLSVVTTQSDLVVNCIIMDNLN
jgi:hypothetical protein